MTQKKLTQLTHSGQKWCWLERLGVGNLILAMEMLSADYGMSWADQWQRNLDDPKWLDRPIKFEGEREKWANWKWAFYTTIL